MGFRALCMGLGWVAYVLGTVGAVGAATPWRRWRYWGFWVSLAADVCWGLWGWGHGSGSAVAMQATYSLTCIYGLWSNRPGRHEK